ncbi:MAG TPA: MarR family transcriptional regulator [Desulfonatronum sp.]|nr:MarR family transcriptional regulator [Desulfonatronum sp.]
MRENNTVTSVRAGLIEAGGRMSQEFGLGRIVGQVLISLYLTDGEASLDHLEEELGLSKAAVSTAARQLENLGFVVRVWKQGDRKSYYRTVDNIGAALRQGLLAMVRRKMTAAGGELETALEALERHGGDDASDRQIRFLHSRVQRAKSLRDRASQILDNPLFKLIGM